jgi:dihydrofolate synthase/folylpolyglutamate synthase
MTFKSTNAFIEYAFARVSKGPFGLKQLHQAMEDLGHPELKLKVIHVAGTNGKGSTTNFLRSIYQTCGYKVGTFTSPHLEVHNDRIRINDEMISNEDLLSYANRFFSIFEQYSLSMFEIDVFIMVHYFLDNKIDLAIIEVGLGGRLDATNIVDPIASVITTIGFDHMDILGHSLQEISFEKAGIIKPNKPIFSSEPKVECIDVFKSVAQEKGSPFYFIEAPSHVSLEEGVVFKFDKYKIHLKSKALYQAYNANLALSVAMALNESIGINIESAIMGVENTDWKGRFEEVSKNPHIILDGAHNEHGILALEESLKALAHPIIVVFTALKDKDTDEMIKSLIEVSDQVIVTEFDFYRAQSLENLKKDLDVLAIKDPSDAIMKGIEMAKEGSLLITGSLYFISLVRQELLPKLLKEHSI